jgi:hypothetical protein
MSWIDPEVRKPKRGEWVLVTGFGSPDIVARINGDGEWVNEDDILLDDPTGWKSLSGTRILLGMDRPEWSTLLSLESAVCPTCGISNHFNPSSGIYTSEMRLMKNETGLSKCWLAGHYDTPVYASRDEVLDRISSRLALTQGQNQ